MFERFVSSFTVDPDATAGVWQDAALLRVRGYEDLMQRFSGRSFDGGLYRLHSEQSGPVCQALTAAAFPDYAERVRVFGMDWLGRQSAIDFGRFAEGEPQVLILEPGTGEALEIPASFEWFHDEEIVDYRNEALASDFFAEWRTSSGWSEPLRLDQCVGYALPLFLGGEDVVANLEVSDVEVYWKFTGEMRRQTRELPPGTPVRGASPTS